MGTYHCWPVDVHKADAVVAVAEGGLRGEVANMAPGPHMRRHWSGCGAVSVDG